MKFHKDNSDTMMTQDMIRDLEEAQKKIAMSLKEKKKEQEEQQEKQRPLINRLTAYGPIGDQLDKIWHDMDEGRIEVNKESANTWYQAIKSAKENNPLTK